MIDLSFGLFAKQHMKKVSVIIPVYNTEVKLLKTCLDSCVNQSMCKKDYEIIIVDDCSKNEETLRLSKDYTFNYSELITYEVLPQNSGVSVARNRGIDLAVGEYVFFVDSDDFIGNETLERMYDFGKANNAELINGRIENAGLTRWIPKSGYTNIEHDVVIDSNSHYMDASTAFKMFKRSHINDINLRFDPKVRSGQDSLFSYTYIMNSESFCSLNDYACCYVVGHNEGHLHLTKMTLENYTYLFETFLSNMLSSDTHETDVTLRITGFIFSMLFIRFNRDIFTNDKSASEKEAIFNTLSKSVNKVLPLTFDKYVKESASALRLMALRSKQFKLYLEVDKLISSQTRHAMLEGQRQSQVKILKLYENAKDKIVIIVSHKTITAENYEKYNPAPQLKMIKRLFRLNKNINNMYGFAYIAVIGLNNGLVEISSRDKKTPIKYEFEIGKTDFKIESVPINYTKEDSSKVYINNKDYYRGSHGLCYLLFDIKSETVLDCFNFDTTTSYLKYT